MGEQSLRSFTVGDNVEVRMESGSAFSGEVWKDSDMEVVLLMKAVLDKAAIAEVIRWGGPPRWLRREIGVKMLPRPLPSWYQVVMAFLAFVVFVLVGNLIQAGWNGDTGFLPLLESEEFGQFFGFLAGLAAGYGAWTALLALGRYFRDGSVGAAY
jgi:hypothetical protein